MTFILALDPGPKETGYVLMFLPDRKIAESGVMPNHQMRTYLQNETFPSMKIAMEMIASYGMAVGAEVFETCLWIGRFMEATGYPENVRLVYRKDVKMHLCGTPRANDANIRQALIDRLGPKGTKKAPGPTYGVKSHAWAALAVAVTAAETSA